MIARGDEQTSKGGLALNLHKNKERDATKPLLWLLYNIC